MDRRRRDVGFGLTPGQAEVLMLRAKGLLREAIAAELDISIDTVKTQLRHAYRKTGVRTASEVARWWNDHHHELTIEPCPVCGRLAHSNAVKLSHEQAALEQRQEAESVDG